VRVVRGHDGQWDTHVLGGALGRHLPRGARLEGQDGVHVQLAVGGEWDQRFKGLRFRV
jgi:hypothetical protein